jgi:hypothetical protein
MKSISITTMGAGINSSFQLKRMDIASHCINMILKEWCFLMIFYSSLNLFFFMFGRQRGGETVRDRYSQE